MCRYCERYRRIGLRLGKVLELVVEEELQDTLLPLEEMLEESDELGERLLRRCLLSEKD